MQWNSPKFQHSNDLTVISPHNVYVEIGPDNIGLLRKSSELRISKSVFTTH